MINDYKLLSFIICLKRFKLNSIILNQPKYKLAKKLSLHPTTFNKYLNKCIEKNYITISENGWKVKKLVQILSDFCVSNQIKFNKHDILKEKSTDFGEVNKTLLDLFVLDNIISQQKFVIKEKSDIKDIHNRIVNPTEHSVKISRKEYDRYRIYRKSCGVGSALGVNTNVITSARHCSKKLGLSLKKANNVLNAGKNFKRIINYFLVNGCDFFTLESLKLKYPKSTLIPFTHLNKTKVCFGSVLIIE